MDVEQRAMKAKEYFCEGYNCAQSVVLAYSDFFSQDASSLASLSAPFGGGMGRLREVCDAVSGMSMIAGALTASSNPLDPSSKKNCYALVQNFAEKFREMNGAIVCRTLLGLDREKDVPIPEARTEQYYKKRPCAMLVADAARIVGEYLNNLPENIR